MKGAINYYGDSNVQFILLNNGGLDTGDEADERWQRYGMPDLRRVRMSDEHAQHALVSTFGHFSYGYVVIGSDGKLLGVNVNDFEVRRMIDEAVNGAADEESGGIAIAARLVNKAGGRTGWNIDDQLPTKMTGTLKLVLSLPKGFHIYGDAKANPEPTVVQVAYDGGLKLGSFVLPKGKQAGGGATHIEGPVTITIPVTAPKGTPIGNYLVHGTVHFMACNQQGCLPPMDVAWTAKIDVF